MSFFSDLVSGNFSNLGNDLAPSNIFSDFGTDLTKIVENPLADLGIAASIALPFAAPEIGAALGFGGAADLSTMGGAAAAGLGAGVDPTAASLGAAATAGDVAGTGALGFADTAATSSALPTWLASPAGDLSPVAPYVAPALPDTGAAAAAAPTANLGAAATASGAPIDLTGGAASSFDLSTIGPGAPGAAAPTNLLPTATAAGTAAPGAVANFASSLTGGAISPATASLIGQIGGPAIGLGGLGYNLYSGYEQKKAQQAITNQINQTAAQEAAISSADTVAAQPLINSGTQLTQYLTTGTLPPAFQQQVTQQVQAAKAAIIQGYATRGQSTNPSDNSALAQDLANVDAQAQTLQANLESTLSTAGTNMISTANQLLASGASAASISGQLPVMIAQLNLNLSNATSSAISNFAAALNGGKQVAPGGTASPTVNLANAQSQQPLSFTF